MDKKDGQNKIFIYNTMGRELQEFAINKVGTKESDTEVKNTEIKMYHCGPTVYWDQHIGNLRAVVMADLIKRTFEYNKDANGNNYKVTLVRNYTDVGHLTGDNIGDADSGEDRMAKAARRDDKNPDEIANFYIERYIKDIKLLNADSADYTPRATKYIDQIIIMVGELLDRGFAYITNQGVYFNIAKYPEYTRLSGQKLDLQNVGSGHGDVSDNHKINSADFALWIFAIGSHANALQTWELTKTKEGEALVKNYKIADKGRGFPGWHMECSAMSKALLDEDNKNIGYTLDIHMGGIEHIPVHHTNEIAQSECANDKKYVKYWLHNEHLLINNKKMSKSEGTAYLLSDVITFLKNYEKEKYPDGLKPFLYGDIKNSTTSDQQDKNYASVLRYFFLQAHYRSKQNFTWEALLASYTSFFIKLRQKYNTLKIDIEEYKAILEADKLDSTNYASTYTNITENDKAQFYKDKFLKAINKDFNIPMALGIMWSMINDKEVGTKDKIDLIEDFNKVFGLFLD